MVRYNGKYKDDLSKTVEEPLEETLPQIEQTPVVAQDNNNWEKRYGDLRRHLSKLETTWKGEKDELKRQVAELVTSSIKMPKNEQELEAFYKQYPDGAAFIETIAAKIAERKVSELGEKYDTQLSDLEKARNDTVKERAYQELLKLHPDFEKIIVDKQFEQWIEKQPKSIKDSLFENDTDFNSASRSLDLYKLETEKAVVRKVNKKSDDLGAAAFVTPTAPASEPLLSGDGKKIWKESEIKKLSSHQFEEVEAEITRAAREGRVMHDLTPNRR